MQISDITIKLASSVRLLGITIDLKLNYKEHINKIVKKSYYKLYALRKLKKFLTLKKVKILACSMIEIQFAYYPLIWKFHTKADMQRVERVQCKILQVVYNHYMATYDDLLPFNNKLKIHQKHLQFLAIEMYKSKFKLNANFMWKTCEEKNTKTQKYGIKNCFSNIFTLF